MTEPLAVGPAEAGPSIAIPSQTIGPFFHVVPSCTEGLSCLVQAATPGERIRLRLRVLDGDGAPVPDALIELRQADASGAYSTPDFPGFGRLGTGPDGWCEFHTIKPGTVVAGGVAQAPHINVCLFARGLLRHLHTRVYFEGDPGLATDPLLTIVPADRRATLLARETAPGVRELVIRLQGEHETVFFDL